MDIKKLKLSQMLDILTYQDVDNFIAEISEVDIDRDDLIETDIEENWRFVGNNINNNASIAILDDPNKGVIERLTNAIDAVIDKQFKQLNLKPKIKSDVVIKEAFPKYYNHRQEILSGVSKKMLSKDAGGKVVLVINEGSKSNKPTIDVIDLGIGIQGSDFGKTILSLQGGNKSTEEKNHLIGSFGQGGSTTLGHSYATIIISKIGSRFWGTIVKFVELENQKSLSYIYYICEGEVPELENDLINFDGEEYLESFLHGESGTLVRMVETEIDKQYRDSEITKPLSLMDYVDIELFNSPLPIRMVDNRERFSTQESSQNRNAYGSFNRLLTSDLVRKEYSGKTEVLHNNRPYSIEYFVILPKDKEKWTSDTECKNDYKRFNIHENPLIYTMNGQYISSERFTRFGNTDTLRFLKYRLLVVVDLDVLGKEKYKFVTSNRKSLHQTDLSKGFFDKVLEQLKREESLKEINTLIGEMSISKPISDEMLEDISNKVKHIYTKQINSNSRLGVTRNKGRKGDKTEEIFYDEIVELNITNSEKTVFKDQQLNIHIQTGAYRSVNEKAEIYLYRNEKEDFDKKTTYLNGRIQYSFDSLPPGDHKIFCVYFENNYEKIVSNEYEFTVVNELSPDPVNTRRISIPDIKVEIVSGREDIVSLYTDEKTGAVIVSVCLDHQELLSVIGKYSSEKIIGFKSKVVSPLALYVLFLKDSYNKIDDSEEKNKFVLAFINTLISEEMLDF